MPALKIKLSQGCQIPSNHIQKECRCLNFKETIEHLKKISLTRFLLLVLLAGTLYGFISGVIGPRDWNWMRITFVSILFLASFIVITVPDHYLEEHIWKHIVKKHIWRIFLWSFGILLATDIGLSFWNLEELVKANMVWVLLLSGLIGIIPESGPHLIFVMMFAKGVIPFSVLLTSSIVQDGHGILPLLSYSLKDSLLIKLFNLIIGLGLGSILLFLGY